MRVGCYCRMQAWGIARVVAPDKKPSSATSGGYLFETQAKGREVPRLTPTILHKCEIMNETRPTENV